VTAFLIFENVISPQLNQGGIMCVEDSTDYCKQASKANAYI